MRKRLLACAWCMVIAGVIHSRGAYLLAEPVSAGEYTGQARMPSAPWCLWYVRPATLWAEALPLGNGPLGAMIFGDPAERCAKRLNVSEAKRYDAIRETHVADHRSLFRRVSLELGRTEAAKEPTDRRIAEFAKRSDPQLAAQVFQ